VTCKNWLDFGADADHVTLLLGLELQLLWRRFALSSGFVKFDFREN